MINANELRIGNWVVLEGKNAMVYGEDIHYLQESRYSCEPIPLTPEILEKAGFVWNEYPDYFNWDLYEKRFCFASNEVKECIYGNIVIKTVHQLQNLYFALTGEELNIQL